jgi:molybdopterin molybdotransferase
MALSAQEAREIVLAAVSALPAERVPILEALGRVLAEDVTSDIDIAPFDNSAMDGFAVRAADLAGATPESPVSLRVTDLIPAGGVGTVPVVEGTASRIMTGAPMPQGADTAVMVEVTRVLEGDGSTGSLVAFEREPSRTGEHVRYKGEEIAAGQVVLHGGEVVRPASIGLLAATGNSEVAVHRRPRVAILSTGDELVEVDQVPGPGQIRNSNTWSLAAQVIAAGGIPEMIGIVRDTEDETRAAFLRAAESDIVCTSGGVSVGDFDYVRPVLEELGSIVFSKVDMRPGNPQTFGEIKGTPFFGLPGNPSSTYVGFEMFVRPSLRKMQGFRALDRPTVSARLTQDVRKKQGRRYYLRASVTRAQDGTYQVSLPGSQSSALLSTAHKSNAFMVLPEGPDEYSTGNMVTCIRLDIEEGTP